MRRKPGFTIVEQAIALVPEFKKVTKRMEEQVVLRGQSISTLSNYIRRIAAFVVHFGKLPEQIDPDDINEYLVALPSLKGDIKLPVILNRAELKELFAAPALLKTTHRTDIHLFCRVAWTGSDQP